jgi:hypothetical protein
MTNFIAIITEKGSQNGQAIANTKNGKYKGMNRDQFIAAVKASTCFSFDVKEI